MTQVEQIDAAAEMPAVKSQMLEILQAPQLTPVHY